MTKITTYHADQIGGNVVVIETAHSRIAIDFGENLPGSEHEPIEIEGLSRGTPCFDGVFFTHYHGDHVGRMHRILPNVPLYLGSIAKKILLNIHQTLDHQNMAALLHGETLHELQDGVSVTVTHDIRVTPYRVDHSAYEAFMFLIETDDTTILHTGDFRGHGHSMQNKAGDPLTTIRKRICQNGQRKIDTLIIEGTMLSRMNERIFTEQELQSWATIFFKKRRHIFLLCSSTNLDTLASFYHAAKANRIKMFANHYVVSQLKTFSETAGVEDDFYRFSTVWPIQFGKELNKNGFRGTQEDYMRKFGFLCIIKEREGYEVWLKKFQDCNPVLLYSMWEGYLDPKRSAYNPLLAAFCHKYHAVCKHTSGHATAELIADIITEVNPTKQIIPIHTENAEMLKKLPISEALKAKIVPSIQNGHTGYML